MAARRLTLVADLNGGRELAVLIGGPWRLRWYWRDELEAMQAAADRYPDSHPAAQLGHYRPTDEHRDHPTQVDVTGRAWRYAYDVRHLRSAS